ncbi:hypothetical protein [Nocardia puris]|uniref:Uncharacterized protein n=1 Tax=Nocardia puris TaxID=208602 RepID=A0A366DAH7_9NOCA|nr:hypothetical protein [Nocardia puris]RBO87061.1 hypothetical protein DFR74_112241 [Nocardia puris]
MTLDRTGDDIPDRCPYDCRRGWLTPDDADVMRACPIHRPRPAQADTSTGHISARAAEAIARADREDRNA